jgi:hypothetical protein
VTRVLLLATPLGPRARLDGSTRAVIDLARALVDEGIARPVVLVREGTEAPRGVEPLLVEANAGHSVILAAAAAARPDVVHAIFAPRIRTGLALAALRAAMRTSIVQTIASWPAAGRARAPAIVGDVVVATSQAAAARIGACATIPMPFAPELVVADARIPRPLVLWVGDWEFGDALEPILAAFATASMPHGVRPRLALAARRKTERGGAIARKTLARIEADPSLSGRVIILGEVPSLLPWIAAATCVVLPARTTYAKLDHPRALLEAIALGTRIVVGAAPTLSELVSDASIGEVAQDESALREALERAFDGERATPQTILRVLSPRAPAVVARAYGEIYARLTARRAS